MGIITKTKNFLENSFFIKSIQSSQNVFWNENINFDNFSPFVNFSLGTAVLFWKIMIMDQKWSRQNIFMKISLLIWINLERFKTYSKTRISVLIFSLLWFFSENLTAYKIRMANTIKNAHIHKISPVYLCFIGYTAGNYPSPLSWNWKWEI